MNGQICVMPVVLAIGVSESAPGNQYRGEYIPGSYGGSVPPLPPFGTPAIHPVDGYGRNGYVTALRYESNVRNPYRTDSAYGYQVDGQSVQVARVVNH